MLHYRDDPQFCADRPMYLRFQDEEEDEDQPTAEEQQAMDRHQQQQALKAAVSRRLFSCFSSSVSSWFLCFLLVLAVALHVFFALSGQRCILARSLGVSRAALPESGCAALLSISTLAMMCVHAQQNNSKTSTLIIITK